MQSVLSRRGTAGLAATALVAGGVAYAGVGATAEPREQAASSDRPDASTVEPVRLTPSARPPVASGPGTTAPALTATTAPDDASTSTGQPVGTLSRRGLATGPSPTGSVATSPAPTYASRGTAAPGREHGDEPTAPAPTPPMSPTPTGEPPSETTLADVLAWLAARHSAPSDSARR